MRKHQQKIMMAVFIVVLAAWMGKSFIRNLFPPKMKFAAAELAIIDNNQPITINSLKGNVVIVCCYQTWCIDCARETPVLNQLATGLNADKFKIIYISDEDAGKVNLFRQRFSSDKILFTKSANRLQDFGINVYPTTFLLNKKGEVMKTKLEGYDWLKETETIKKLMQD